MHPWEDWAETFAHTLHILDALQTAAATGLTVISRDVPGIVVAPGDVEGRPFDQVVEQWIPLAGALNALNRSMGEADLYPFVLSPDGDRQAGLRRPARAVRAGSGGRLTATARRSDCAIGRSIRRRRRP